MSDLTEQVIAQLYDYLDDKDTTTDAANKIIRLIREQIAKDIEAIQISKPTMETHFGYITAITEAAAIARGEVSQ